MTEAPSQPELPVGDMIAQSIMTLLSAAALHLGERTTGGAQAPAQPDPDEAWRALLAAASLIRRMRPLLPEAVPARWQTLTSRLAATYPDREFPVPPLS